MPRVRLDSLLAERGLFESRTRAAAAVLAGEVRLGSDGRRASKAGQLVDPAVEVSVDDGQTWANARLTGDDAPYAWRQWQFSWTPQQPGAVTILARATDDRGQTQPMASPWNPGGFLWNGVDRVQVEVKST